MRNHSRRFGALTVYLILQGVSALLFQLVWTIYVIYYARGVGLDAFQIVLMGTVFETTIFLFEVPTGVVADVYSRRLSVIVGVALMGLGLLIAGLFPVVAAILIHEVITGIAATFLSGATEAWIADEVGEAQAGRAFVRGGQMQMAGGIVGIILSVALASTDLRLPFVISAAVFLALAAFLIVFMPEDGFRPAAERTTWRRLFATARDGLRLVRVRPALAVILAVQFIFAFHTEGFDHLWQKFILDDFALPSLGTLSPIVWFGIIGLGANLLGIGVSEWVRRRVDLSDHAATARALLAIYLLLSGAIVVFSLAGTLGVALVAYWLVAALRVAGDPVSKAWLNRHVEPRLRATVFSLNGQSSAIGEIVGGPPIGALAQLWSLRAALAACGLVLALTLPLFGVTLRHTPAAEEE